MKTYRNALGSTCGGRNPCRIPARHCQKNGFYRVMGVMILSLSLVKDFPVKRFSFFESYYGFQTFRSCEYVRGRLTHQSLKSNIKFQKLKE